MFSWDILIALAIIIVTAKIFYRLGYTECFSEICETYKVDSDDLLEDLINNSKNNK